MHHVKVKAFLKLFNTADYLFFIQNIAATLSMDICLISPLQQVHCIIFLHPWYHIYVHTYESWLFAGAYTPVPCCTAEYYMNYEAGYLNSDILCTGGECDWETVNMVNTGFVCSREIICSHPLSHLTAETFNIISIFCSLLYYLMEMLLLIDGYILLTVWWWHLLRTASGTCT